jgi:hypothetical protein
MNTRVAQLLKILPVSRTTQTQNKRTQISMTRVEIEPTIPVFERAKTVHALHRAATSHKLALIEKELVYFISEYTLRVSTVNDHHQVYKKY